MSKQPKRIDNPNTIGRPKGSRNKRTLIREALQKAYPEGEAGFWQAVASMAQAGDLQAMTMIADRLYPKLKPTSELMKLSEPLEGTPAQMARQLMKSASIGEVDPGTAKELLSALADLIKIIESTELEARIEKLEAINDEQS